MEAMVAAAACAGARILCNILRRILLQVTSCVWHSALVEGQEVIALGTHSWHEPGSIDQPLRASCCRLESRSARA